MDHDRFGIGSLVPSVCPLGGAPRKPGWQLSTLLGPNGFTLKVRAPAYTVLPEEGPVIRDAIYKEGGMRSFRGWNRGTESYHLGTEVTCSSLYALRR